MSGLKIEETFAKLDKPVHQLVLYTKDHRKCCMFLIPGTGTQACDVVVSYGTLAPITLTGAGGYTYSDAKTPTVTSVTPKVGVTSGGDSLTVTGTDFG